MNTSVKTAAASMASSLSARTVDMLNSIPPGRRDEAFKAILARIDPNVAKQVSAARDRGYAFPKALEIGYQNMLAQGIMQGIAKSAAGVKANGGLGNQNSPASSPAASSTPSTSPGGFSADSLAAGLRQGTDLLNQVGGLVDAAGSAYGSLMNIVQPPSTPAAAPAPIVIDPAAIRTLSTRLSVQRRPVTTPTDTGTSAGASSWSLSSIPTYALAIGAAVGAGGLFYAIRKMLAKKSK